VDQRPRIGRRDETHGGIGPADEQSGHRMLGPFAITGPDGPTTRWADRAVGVTPPRKACEREHHFALVNADGWGRAR